MWSLNFISEDALSAHVLRTIEQYGQKLHPFNLQRFNKNHIDPIKMIFDRAVYGLTWEELVKSEIIRQRDKATNNDIGYFHQNIFSYFPHCRVPANGTQGGWDVIWEIPQGLTLPDGGAVHRVYVELKNKHNTMNSASAAKTYAKMQAQLLADDDCACFLVEAISKRSQNIKWSVSLNGTKAEHRFIRRVSIDCFYDLVTGEENSFYRLCLVLPELIENMLRQGSLPIPQDTVYQELCALKDREHISLTMAMLLLGFASYKGFPNRAL